MGVLDGLANTAGNVAGGVGSTVGGAAGAVGGAIDSTPITPGPNAGGVGDYYLGKTDEWFAQTGPGNTVDTVKDIVGSGHEDDTIDVFGPALFGTEASVADVATTREGEDRSGDRSGRKWVLALVVVGVLVAAAPVLRLATEVLDDE